MSSVFRKPAVVPVTQNGPFVCEVCGFPGWGPPTSKVHQNRCRAKKTRELAKKSAEKRKLKRIRVEEASAAA